MILTETGSREATAFEIAEVAAHNAIEAMNRVQPLLDSPTAAVSHIRGLLVGLDYEVFLVVLLDNRHRVIRGEVLFRGTIDGASVHPREVVKLALWAGAASVVFAHNHPSGVAQPSQADELITLRLKEALALIEVRVLDHVIVGNLRTYSFAEHGLI
jgi:DNA repair protein RadC